MNGLKPLCLLLAIFGVAVHTKQIQRRMKQGLEKDIKEIPYMVAFYKSDNSVVGSGAILSDKWVLTSAQMWATKPDERDETNDKDNTFIKYGATVVEDDGEQAMIKRVVTHPMYLDQFDPGEAKYDVAVVETVDPMNLKAGYAEAKPLLADGYRLRPGEICLLAGYGITSDPEKDAKPRLQFLPTPILTRFICRFRLNGIPNNMICGGQETKPAGPCEDDYGAPLVCNHAIAAILSRGNGCSGGNHNINKFVKVAFVRPFIFNNTGIE